MPSILEVQEFFVEGRDPSRAHVLLHIAEPTAPHEKDRGYLFALVEITQGSPEQIQKLQELIDKVENSFYAKEEAREYILERVLQNINRAGSALLNYPGSAIHAVVGSLRGGAVALASHGWPTAALFYNGEKQLEATEIIVADEGTGDGSLDRGQTLFSEIIEGDINPGDYLYLATPHVADFFTLDRVRKLVESRTTRQSMTHLEKVLRDVGSDYSFGGLLFHLTDATDTPRTGSQPKTFTEDGSEQSLNKFLAATKSTEDTLSPPLLGDMGKKIGGGLKSLFSPGKKTTRDKNVNADSVAARDEAARAALPGRIRSVETNHRYKVRADRDSIFSRSLVGLGKTVLFVAQGIVEAARRIFMGAIRSGQWIFMVAINRRRSRARALANLRLAIASKRRFVAELPLMSKIILAVTALLLLVFLGSLGYMKVKEIRDAKELAYKNLASGIKDKTNAAGASLIYDQKGRAVELMREAETLLQQLPQKTKEEKETANRLTAELQALSEKLRNLKTVRSELLADLAAANKEARAAALAKVGGELIAYGPDETKLYTINLASKEVGVNASDLARGFSFALVPAEEDKVVLLTAAGELMEYEPKTGALVYKSIAYPNTPVSLTAAGIYNRKLYLADALSKQIYKHSPTQIGYDRGAPWLKLTNEAMAEARALALDGDVYILTKSGAVEKFFTGEAQPFTLTGLDPALSEPTALITGGDLKNIYILESAHRRLVVLDKTGAFNVQYTATEWEAPTGLVVEDDGKTAYVLDKNKVYKVAF